MSRIVFAGNGFIIIQPEINLKELIDGAKRNGNWLLLQRNQTTWGITTVEIDEAKSLFARKNKEGGSNNNTRFKK